MTERVRADAIEIDFRLHDFVRHEAAPGTGVDPAAFWRAADSFERENGNTYREFELALPRELERRPGPGARSGALVHHPRRA